MRDLSKSLPRELVSILEPLLAYRVGDYSLRTSYKSKTSTLSISFDLCHKKRPLVKAPAKTKPKEKPTPAPTPAALSPVQRKRPPKVKKTPPVSIMEIEESLPTTPPPPTAAPELAPLESSGEEPFRSPEGTGHGRKKRKRRSIFSPDASPLPAPTITKSIECQTADPPGPELNDSHTQTATPPVPPLRDSHTQTNPVKVPKEKPEDARLMLTREAAKVMDLFKHLPPPASGKPTNRIKL
ncbi:gibberellin-regulated protein 14-like [Haliotis rufescens]|uniref:gibberellin-regulated protein 14-like n=1 Tax=Haliotis rufescens TaxID=6454 RepID=UPI00201F56C5|nr:gibberellin-regulated protein 14-like [Haliotis rufescens]